MNNPLKWPPSRAIYQGYIRKKLIQMATLILILTIGIFAADLRKRVKTA